MSTPISDDRQPAHDLTVDALLASMPTGAILVRGASGERVDANRRAEALLGHPLSPDLGVAQLVGQVCWPNREPCPFDDLPAVRALRGAVITGQEMLLRRTDGKEIPVLISAGALRDDAHEVVGAIVVIDDLTPIKEGERIREEWTSIVAHDLRQPVAVITGYASQLVRQQDPASEVARRAAEHILACARQMNRMISDLLDSSRLEARRLTLQWQMVDLAELIATVVERSAEVTQGHSVHVTIATANLPRVRVDPSRIEQVMGNLLSNAARYSYEGTDIHVEVRRVDQEIEIVVANEGDGIAPDELGRLFTRFHRPSRPPGGATGGLGLGLYITRGLVEAHGGRIWAESTPGQRTAFYVRLPERASVQ